MILLMFLVETFILASPQLLCVILVSGYFLKKSQYLVSSHKVEGNALIHLYSSLTEICFNHVATCT